MGGGQGEAKERASERESIEMGETRNESDVAYVCVCVYLTHVSVAIFLAVSVHARMCTNKHVCYAVCDIRTLGLFLNDVAPT